MDNKLDKAQYKNVLIGPFNTLEELKSIWGRLGELGWLSISQFKTWDEEEFYYHSIKKGRKYVKLYKKNGKFGLCKANPVESVETFLKNTETVSDE